MQAVIQNALEEDIGSGDITAQLLPEASYARGVIICREEAVICGIQWAGAVFQQVDPQIRLNWQVKDGNSVIPDQLLAKLEGPIRSILTAERTALNFLQTLSGTATLTQRYVKALDGMKTQLIDTRKTLPGLREAQKYAVRCGGGVNHRMGLYDAYLIKENHILACGSIAAAVARARESEEAAFIEVEVETLDELRQALAASVDRIMLDNFSLAMIREAVEINQGKAKIEVSGGVSLNNILEIAKTGVDYISVGALTKNVNAVDLSLRLVE